MPAAKRTHENKENLAFVLVDPTVRKKRRTLPQNPHTSIPPEVNQRRALLQIQQDGAAREVTHRAQEEEEARKASLAAEMVEQAWKKAQEVGFSSMHTFVLALLNTNDPVRSSQVSRMVANHGNEILDAIHRRNHTVANDWAISSTRQLILAERALLVKRFQPEIDSSIVDILDRFSLKRVLEDTKNLAPTLHSVLHQVGAGSSVDTVNVKGYKNRDHVSVSLDVPTASKSINEHLDSCNYCLYANQVMQPEGNRVPHHHRHVFPCVRRFTLSF